MRRVAAVLIPLIVAAWPAGAQSHPDLSGRWVLDSSAVQGPMAPQAMTLVVSQDEKTMKVESTATTQRGDQKGTMVMNLDGSESKSTVTTPNGPLEMTSTAAWDGPALVVTTSAEIQGQPLKQTDRWTLGEGGRTLSLQRSIAVAGQTFDVTLSFVKQP